MQATWGGQQERGWAQTVGCASSNDRVLLLQRQGYYSRQYWILFLVFVPLLLFIVCFVCSLRLPIVVHIHACTKYVCREEALARKKNVRDDMVVDGHDVRYYIYTHIRTRRLWVPINSEGGSSSKGIPRSCFKPTIIRKTASMVGARRFSTIFKVKAHMKQQRYCTTGLFLTFKIRCVYQRSDIQIYTCVCAT